MTAEEIALLEKDLLVMPGMRVHAGQPPAPPSGKGDDGIAETIAMLEG